MLFNSLQFLVFFPMVVAAYFATPHRHRWWLLLVASYYFYMCWKPEYVVLIVASTLIDYFVAIAMSRQPEGWRRRRLLLVSLCGNLGMLFGFKYANFAGENVSALLESVNVFVDAPVFDWLLPVGISFYTFQTLGYSIDVYRGAVEPERHLGKFAVYVAFFPQLVAGPIERASRLLPQFDREHRFDLARVREGLTLMLWGFFKKLVIADQAAIHVDHVYGAPDQFSGTALLVASYLFAFQIYCDFSGYSDIAIGSARVLGIDLTENFNRPFFARSLNDFWRRWHISLSTWFRDYVYIPMRAFPRLDAGWSRLLILWALIGLWHGAAWHFVAWGVFQSIVMGIERTGARLLSRTRDVQHVDAGDDAPRSRSDASRSRWATAVSVFVTFQVMTVGMVLFRAPSVTSAFACLGAMLQRFEPSLDATLAGRTPVELAAVWLPIVFLLAIELWQGDRSFIRFFADRSSLTRGALICTLVFAIACLGVFEGQDFIYFQF